MQEFPTQDTPTKTADKIERQRRGTSIDDSNPEHAPCTNPASDPVFQQEQQHLSQTYATLQRVGRGLARQIEQAAREAAADKKSMAEELAPNFATFDDAMETYADFAAMNRVIDGYNLAHDTRVEELNKVELLLKQPYFAKVALQFKPGDAPKELYIGNAGIADESYRRIVVDWRSPVAEVYYNQDMGPTSYQANGRTISVDLKLRRQFDIEENRLKSYFDTNVAIQDSLLLASLSRNRTAHMQAITATIQKEQNLVIRHKDVPALLVSGIAGSGKTSVLLQRIAYLFYQNRADLDPREVFLITPNPVFRSYIEGVLPDLGERNPEIITWDELAATLLPKGQGTGNTAPALADLDRIDASATPGAFDFEPNDFRDVQCEGTRLISADQVRKISNKFRNIPAGPHRVTLMREELYARLEARLAQMAATEEAADELSLLSIDEQLRIFHETIAPQNEQEERTLALRYLRDRYAGAFRTVENDDWLRIDRIGMRILDEPGLSPLAWLYLKMALTGLSNPNARYVIIDEAQDYTAAQLAVIARYFRRAHFLLLGDPNQAITQGTAPWTDIRNVFLRARGSVEECRLMTSYRSTPEVTNLFASLLPEDERMTVSAVQRDEIPPTVIECPTRETWLAALRKTLQAVLSPGEASESDDPEAHSTNGAESASSSKPDSSGKPASADKPDSSDKPASAEPQNPTVEKLPDARAASSPDNAEPQGLTAIIVPHKHAAHLLQQSIEEAFGASEKAAAAKDAVHVRMAEPAFGASEKVAAKGIVAEEAPTHEKVASYTNENDSAHNNLPKAIDRFPLTLVEHEGDLPASGVVLITLKLAKGLEFDHVIIPDATERTFPQNPLSQRRLYTTISRATRRVTLLAPGKLTPLLSAWQQQRAS